MDANQHDGEAVAPPIRAVGTSVDITPSTPIPLAGRGAQPVAQHIADRLECNLLLLRCGGTQLLLASFDLLYVGESIRSALESAVDADLDQSGVFVAASHTHNAPSTDPARTDVGRHDPNYVAFVEERVAAEAERLLTSASTCVETFVAQTQMNHSINRRLRRLRPSKRGLASAIALAPNPEGSRDEIATVLVFRAGGMPVAALWNYACHPSSFPNTGSVSADYPGIVRARIRERLGQPTLPVLFLQGFSGDTRAPFIRRIRSPRDLAVRVALGPRFSSPTPPGDYTRWAESLAQRISHTASAAKTYAGPGLSARRIAVSGSDFFHSTSRPDFSMSFHSVQIGEAVIVGGSGEFVSSYARLVRELAAERTVLPTGYIDSVAGYVPTSVMLPEGGYEVDGFCHYFNVDSVTQSVEAATMDSFRRVLRG